MNILRNTKKTDPANGSNSKHTRPHANGKGSEKNNSADQRNNDNRNIVVSVADMLNQRHLANSIDLSTRRRSTSCIDGSSRSSFRGRGMEFAEVRPYNPGDDIRNIDWRVTARTQQTYTKLFQEEKERPVYLVVDQRSSMFFASQGPFKSVFAAKIASIIAWAALNNNDRIGAIIFSDTQQIDLRAKQGKHALLQLIFQLQQYNQALMDPKQKDKDTSQADISRTPDVQGESLSLYEMLKDLGRVAKPGSAVFVISDFWDFDDSCKEPLAMAARHADVHLIKTFDHFEKSLPSAPNLLVTDGQQKIDLHNVNQRDYSHQFERQQQVIEQFCLNHKMNFTPAANTIELSELLSSMFAQKRQSKKRG